MSNRHFRLTEYQPLYSRELITRSKQFEEKSRLRYTSHQSAIFKKEVTTRFKQTDIQNLLKNHHTGFGTEKPSPLKAKLNKGAYQSAHLPSFHIKKIFGKEVNKGQERQLEQDGLLLSQSQRRRGNQQDMKKSWQRYLNEQISYAYLAKQLNRNILESPCRERRNQSQAKTPREKGQGNATKVEKSAFYVNNFIKTRYQRRKMQNEDHCLQEMLQKSKQSTKLEESNRKSQNIDKEIQKNWQMMPWQQLNDSLEEQFSGL